MKQLSNELDTFCDNDKEGDKIIILQSKDRHEAIVDIKLKLNWLGYSGIKITPLFGPFLEKRVREFQRDNNLIENGILDEITITRINDAFLSIDWTDTKNFNVRYFKRNLNLLGFSGIIINNIIGDYTTEKIKEFQSFYDLYVTGFVNLETIYKINELITSPLQLYVRHKDVKELKILLNHLGYGPVKTTEKYGRRFQEIVKEYQREHSLPVSGIIDYKTLENIRLNSRNLFRKTFVKYNIFFDEFADISKRTYQSYYARNIQLEFLDPDLLLKDRIKKFYFFHLIRTNVVSEGVLNKYLKGKGILENQAGTFLEAANKNRINELYLLAIVLVNSDRYPEILRPLKLKYDETFIKDSNVISKRKLFNPFGIGRNPSLEDYAKYAHISDWTTVEKSILEGAKLYKDSLSSYEINSFYTKLWSPKYVENQKSSRLLSRRKIEWIEKIIHKLYLIHNHLEHYTLHLNIPTFVKK